MERTKMLYENGEPVITDDMFSREELDSLYGLTPSTKKKQATADKKPDENAFEAFFNGLTKEEQDRYIEDEMASMGYLDDDFINDEYLLTLH